MADRPRAMNPAPVCSVCIANYNGETMLRECIDSVLAQDEDIAVETIVHDDASTDASVELLHRTYPQIGFLASRANVGFCVANNRMVTQARGEFVLLLNNDAALMPGALRALIDAARAQAGPAIFTLPQYDWQNGELVDRGCLLDPFYNPVPNRDPARAEVAMAIGACMFLPRSLWDELGGFPEWMESIGEDLYLCCLARLRSYPVIALNISGYRHRQGASFGGSRVVDHKLLSTIRRRRLSERNKTSTLIICTPSPAMWLLLAIHLMLLLAEGAVVSLIRRDCRLWTQIYLSTVRDQWRARRRLHALRQLAQRHRRIRMRGYLAAFTWVPRKLALLVRHGIPRFAQ